MTELVFILDRSGSMSGLESDTIGGFNSMIAQQKKEAGEAVVSTVLFAQRQTVMDDRAVVGEKHRGDQRLPRFPLLLFDHGVEAADGVRLQPRHGAAAIQDENQFCHNENPPSFDCALIVAQPKEGLVACGATFMTIA